MLETSGAVAVITGGGSGIGGIVPNPGTVTGSIGVITQFIWPAPF